MNSGGYRKKTLTWKVLSRALLYRGGGCNSRGELVKFVQIHVQLGPKYISGNVNVSMVPC